MTLGVLMTLSVGRINKIRRVSYFTEPALLWLADTVMGEVEARKIPRSQQFCGWLAWLWARSRPVTFHGATNTVVGQHSYGRGRNP